MVLDLGCGDGRALPGMLLRGWTVTALDSSSRAIGLARTLDNANEVMFAVGNAVHLPFRDATFDAVFAAHLAGHLAASGRARLGKELDRVLSQSGRLFFRDFAEGDFRCGQGMPVEPGTWVRKNGIATHYFTEQEVKDLFLPMVPITLRTRDWEIRIRGEGLPRREIEAVFIKAGI